jgi:hypothetical protein
MVQLGQVVQMKSKTVGGEALGISLSGWWARFAAGGAGRFCV